MKKQEFNKLTINDINTTVELYGWVSKKRDLGGLVFIDLRDRTGIIQLVVNPENEYYELASSLKNEYVIKVIGTIKKRENPNKNLATGEIEVIVNTLELINTSIEVPFEISDNTNALEDTRLKYRYLDLRRESLKNKLLTRHQITRSIRNFLGDFEKNESIYRNYL